MKTLACAVCRVTVDLVSTGTCLLLQAIEGWYFCGACLRWTCPECSAEGCKPCKAQEVLTS